MSRTRSVIIDDTNNKIIYSKGSWFLDTGSRDQTGNFGPPYGSTLHGIQADGTASFMFNGTGVSVYGANNPRNDSGVIDPTWECFVDQISIGATAPFSAPENNWLLCENSALVDGPHNLTISVTVNKKQTFWLDRIQYIPSQNVSLDNEAILVENSDPAFTFSDGWQDLGGSWNMTRKKGAKLNFEFTGVSAAWYSLIPVEQPGNATTGSYSIDGGPLQAFNLRGHDAKAITTYYYQKFFQTNTIPMGRHNLFVVYNGNSNSAPLTLDYIIVENGTSAIEMGQKFHSHPINIGALVGGVVGGVVVIALAILAFLFIRRRRRRRRRGSFNLVEDDLSQVSRVQPFEHETVDPSSHPATNNGGTSEMVSSSHVRSSYVGMVSTGKGLLHLTNDDGPSMDASSSNRPMRPGSNKAREAMQKRGSHNDIPGSSAGIIQHRDSGVRGFDNPSDELGAAVELPPHYTPG